ncbi:MAG: cobalamin-dependent protein [Nitrospinae bacterium]|nr:cobalamin-dependent protein [Nitrospinota bacterium]
MQSDKPKTTLVSLSVVGDGILAKYYHKLPSLGIAYLASSLERAGYQVSLFDKSVSLNQKEYVVNEILSRKPDIVGFYIITESFHFTLDIIRTLKAKHKGLKIWVGGPHVYCLPEETIAHEEIDCACVFEGEEMIVKLLDSNFDSREMAKIDGLIYKENNKIIQNKPALIKDLDSLAKPARHLFGPLKDYRPSIVSYKKLPATGILTSRGCASRCTFCHSGKGELTMRYHSPEYVIDEISQLVTDYGIKELFFFDDTFTTNRPRVIEICETIIRNNIKISWSSMIRVTGINKELLQLMKRAGCWLVQIGVESGSQEVLNLMKKDIKLEQVKNVTRMAYDVGLEVKGYFIIGNAGDTVETLDKTIDLIKELPFHYASINHLTPLPGTELWETGHLYGDFEKKNYDKVNYLSDSVNYIPKGLTEEIINKKFKEAYLGFYLNPKTIFRFLKTIKSFDDIKRMLGAISLLSAMLYVKITGIIKNGTPTKS